VSTTQLQSSGPVRDVRHDWGCPQSSRPDGPTRWAGRPDAAAQRMRSDRVERPCGAGRV